MNAEEAVDPAVDPALAAWTDALERLEQVLREALAGGAFEPGVWTPPAGLGPLPVELRERATRLLDAQQHTLRHLADMRRSTARHLSAVRSVPRDASGPAPVYVDLVG
ncbi:hypothetical protein P5G50_03060 [Leifsonia sp. F6_8S_P_1B]|uniref:Flagellar protein FliT n=1 Tax=Leifsonia williamsii TaxID=3035919 RepID=A0ABT8KAQ3_9MICO|nr:hypothetical protein [Leifsonia williamsii]MDN4613424.1 hypothetical protein [Leifsonia williamsii]